MIKMWFSAILVVILSCAVVADESSVKRNGRFAQHGQARKMNQEVKSKQDMTPKLLDSFCGFKAMEGKSAFKARNGVFERSAKEPFLGLRTATLRFSPGDRLIGVESSCKTKIATATFVKKDFQRYQDELMRRYDILFDGATEKVDDGPKLLEIHSIGYGPGVRVDVNATLMTLNAKIKKQLGVVRVEVYWQEKFYSCPVVEVKPVKSKSAPKQNMEESLGFRFGEPLPATFKIEETDTIQKRSHDMVLRRRLSAPISGLYELELHVLPQSGKLEYVEMKRAYSYEQSEVLRRKFAEVCDGVRNWLELGKFTIEEHDEANNGCKIEAFADGVKITTRVPSNLKQGQRATSVIAVSFFQ